MCDKCHVLSLLQPLRLLLASVALLLGFALGTPPAGAQPAPGAASAGQVTFVSGEAFIDLGGSRRLLKVGDDIPESAVLDTGANSHLHVKTSDRGFLLLRPKTRAVVEIYRADLANPEKTAIRLRLESGVLRSITGQAAESAREKFRLNTPVAAIGIRGTDFTVLADSRTTRAVVASGAIVMSGFGEDCRQQALGPCGGSGAESLTAAQTGKVLQFEAGQQRPVLRNVREVISPDQYAPPVTQEPPRKASEKSTDGDSYLASVTGKQLLVDNLREASLSTGEIQSIAPPAYNWGRWSMLTGELGAAFTEWLRQNGELVALNGEYFMARQPGELTLPQSGRVDFRLEHAEAILRDYARAATSSGNVTAGQLGVDFASRQFSTRLDVQAEGQQYRLQANGQVTPDGRLVGNYPYTDQSTDTFVRGTLDGKQAARAGYIFERRLDEGQRALYGVTNWRR